MLRPVLPDSPITARATHSPACTRTSERWAYTVCHACAVAQHDPQAVEAPAVAGPQHDAVRRGQDRRADRHPVVHALVAGEEPYGRYRAACSPNHCVTRPTPSGKGRPNAIPAIPITPPPLRGD